MPTEPQGLFYALCLLGIGGAAFLAMVRHQRLTLWAYFLVVVLEGSRWLWGPGPLLQGVTILLGGVSIYPLDVFTAVFWTSGVAGLLSRRLPTPLLATLALATGLVVVRLLTLASVFGLASAVNLSRPHLLIIGIVLWSATAPSPWRTNDLWAVVASSLLGTTLFLLAAVRSGFGSSIETRVIDGVVVSARPTVASVALLTVLGLVVLASGRLSMGGWRLPVSALLAASVLLQQHRSAWVAALAAAVLMTLTYVGITRGRRAGTWATVLLASLAAVPITLFTLRRSQQLGESSSSAGTWQWRIDRWQEALSEKYGVADWAVGQVLVTDGIRTDVPSSHSLYVDAVVTLGVLGLVGFLMLWWVSVLHARRLPLSTGGRMLVAGWIGASLGYGVTYQTPAFAYLLVGVIGSMAVRLSSRSEMPEHRSRATLAS